MSGDTAIDRVLALAAIPELTSLHPDDLASLAERVEEQRAGPGEPLAPGDACALRFLLSGGVAVGAARREIEAPALVGVAEALSGADLALHALAGGAQLLALPADALRWLMEDLFEVRLVVLRHLAARLLAAEPLAAEPARPSRPPIAEEPDSLAARILLLSECEILEGLPAYSLGCLAAQMEEEHLPARTRLWEPGAPADHVFVIVDGEVVSRPTRSHSARQSHRAGALLGLREALAGRARATRVHAVAETRVLRLGSEALIDELEDDPPMAAHFVDALAQRTLRAEAARAPSRRLGR